MYGGNGGATVATETQTCRILVGDRLGCFGSETLINRTPLHTPSHHPQSRWIKVIFARFAAVAAANIHEQEQGGAHTDQGTYDDDNENTVAPERGTAGF
jgi:hypothetical protein